MGGVGKEKRCKLKAGEKFRNLMVSSGVQVFVGWQGLQANAQEGEGSGDWEVFYHLKLANRSFDWC